MSGTDKGILMSKLADLIEQNKELFATIDAWDNGNNHCVLMSPVLTTIYHTDFSQASRTMKLSQTTSPRR